jgi:hypothetical protein
MCVFVGNAALNYRRRANASRSRAATAIKKSGTPYSLAFFRLVAHLLSRLLRLVCLLSLDTQMLVYATLHSYPLFFPVHPPHRRT